jgi:LCP family protein required for cell wall assembly
VSDPDAPQGATSASGDPADNGGRHRTRRRGNGRNGNGNGNDVAKPKRRAKVKKRHTVARVLLVTTVVLAMVTGLSTLYLYRHYNSNLDVLDISKQLVDRPPKKKVEGPKEPLNILVMGSDDRDAPGNNIDNLTGGGKRSDTTILLHLSADRKRAYGISIPRDSLVNRPECLDDNLNKIPGGTDVMWNEAFSVGGPACTVHQFETLTGIRVDHFVVVDFAGFRGMVDAIGGVQVCIPPPGIVDPSHGINLPAGTRKLEGIQALNYVRERYVLGNGSDIGRMKRQQAFIASMAHQVISANTLANPPRLLRFLDAATKSLQLDKDLGNLVKIAKLGVEFKNIGLDNIQFITIPWEYAPEDPNRIRWLPAAKQVWQAIINDKPLAPRFLSDAINAERPPGSPTPSGTPSPTGTPSGSPSSSPSSPSSPSSSPSSDAAEQAAENGLCS